VSSNPLVAHRIKEIQDQAAIRRQKREAATAELAERQARNEEEQRACISPRDLERQAAHKAACEYWSNIYQQEQEREYHQKRNAAIEEMKILKNEWDKSETTPARRAVILRTYGLLYRKYEPKPNTTTDEVILKFWENERRKAALRKIFGAGASQ
jgi:hypothetical protein